MSELLAQSLLCIARDQGGSNTVIESLSPQRTRRLGVPAAAPSAGRRAHRYRAVVRVVVDTSDTMVALGQVAVWSFDLAAWGECVQAPDEVSALEGFAHRTGCAPWQLEVGERITGPDAVFREDMLPATGAQVARTIEILDEQRARVRSMLVDVPDRMLDAEDPRVEQPPWMTWRTPRAILRHIIDTESRAYPRW